jgi:hypothetical protein
MGWQDILKSEEEEGNKLLEELVNNVHFFWEGASIDNIVMPFEPYSYNVDNYARKLKPLVRSLEFMRPVKDDLEFVGRGTRILFSYHFKLFGKRCGVQFRHHELGEIAEDVFIMVGGTEVCVKGNGVMTKGDFLTTLVLAEKNNSLPDILKFVAYAKNAGIGDFTDNPDRYNTVYNSSEEEYKKFLLLKLYEKWEKSDLFDYNEEINIDLIKNFNLNDVNFWLVQFEVPQDILGRW